MKSFSEHAETLFKETKPDTVVEVGPDISLRLMSSLGRLCSRYIGVTLPEYYEESSKFLKRHQENGLKGGELIAGNAIELSGLAPRADIVIVHNVLLYLTGEDTKLMKDYYQGIWKPDEAEKAPLKARFKEAQVKSYQEMLKVANPGLILTFHRPQLTDAFIETMVSEAGVERSLVEVTQLEPDPTFFGLPEAWDLVTIDNTGVSNAAA